MKWIKFKKSGNGRPKQTGEYIVRFYQDQFTGIKVVCYMKYDANEGCFMAEHDDIYNLEWLSELEEEINTLKTISKPNGTTIQNP